MIDHGIGKGGVEPERDMSVELKVGRVGVGWWQVLDEVENAVANKDHDEERLPLVIIVVGGVEEELDVCYFNPVGVYQNGDNEEDPKRTPNNLLPFIQQMTVGRHPKFNVYDHDYHTCDDTIAGDYIHVVDLADGHASVFGNLYARHP
ncbi:UDP-D-glucose epimerase 3 [Hordeum vulgare]|nr:UDP-D-glucose epimerase 3 [Hordeum vulgare]